MQEKERRALRLLQYNEQREQAALAYQMKAAGLKVSFPLHLCFQRRFVYSSALLGCRMPVAPEPLHRPVLSSVLPQQFFLSKSCLCP